MRLRRAGGLAQITSIMLASNVYPSECGFSFANTYGDFHNGFVKEYNKHFCIGKPGSRRSDTASKEVWVKALATADSFCISLLPIHYMVRVSKRSRLPHHPGPACLTWMNHGAIYNSTT